LNWYLEYEFDWFYSGEHIFLVYVLMAQEGIHFPNVDRCIKILQIFLNSILIPIFYLFLSAVLCSKFSIKLILKMSVYLNPLIFFRNYCNRIEDRHTGMSHQMTGKVSRKVNRCVYNSTKSIDLTFIGPCIVIHFYSTTN
jgi:hypothetical protein